MILSKKKQRHTKKCGRKIILNVINNYVDFLTNLNKYQNQKKINNNNINTTLSNSTALFHPHYTMGICTSRKKHARSSISINSNNSNGCVSEIRRDEEKKL